MAVNLSSGFKMPLIGAGTSRVGSLTAQIVETALKLGYRHIDTAYIYGVETEVGRGLRSAIEKGYVSREEVFLTSKLWCSCYRSDLVKPAVQETVRNLGVDYLDLCLLHYPAAVKQATLDDIKEKETASHRFATHLHIDAENYAILSDVGYLEAWEGLEECISQGLVRSIGLSSFNSVQIQDVIDHARVRPSVVQIECHPYLTQESLVRFCHDRGIHLTAFSPLGGKVPTNEPTTMNFTRLPSLHEDARLMEIACRHGKTPAQVVLRFNIQRDVIVIPKTCNEHRLKENLNVFDFVLSDEEMKTIHGMNAGLRNLTGGIFQKSKQFPFNIPF